MRHRYRISPHPHQEKALARASGCACVVRNDAWAPCRNLYRQGETCPGSLHSGNAASPKPGAHRKRCITQARRRPERTWFAEVANVPLQQSLRKLDQALPNWWGRLKGSRKGKACAPRCKRRSRRQSIRLQSNAFGGGGGEAKLTRVAGIPMAWSRSLAAGPSSVTLTRGCAGRYVASFVVVVERQPLPPNGNIVGVDLGLASLVVTRDGVKITPPRHSSAPLSDGSGGGNGSLIHKAKGANNRATVADQHLDHVHKLATGPIREHQTVCIGHLNVAGVARNRKLSKAIAVVSRWQPTSRIGSEWGDRIGKLPLSKRQWLCPDCRTGHHRDGNAAQTILAARVAVRVNAWGAEGRSGWPPSGCEAGTHLNPEVQRWTA